MRIRRIVLVALLLAGGVSQAWAKPVRLSGRVTAVGKGLAGVAVTDGASVVLTDKRGKYTLESDTERPFVYISTPAGYESPFEDGVVRFYQRRGEAKVYDFQLTPKALDDSRHIFVAVADPQVHFQEDLGLLESAAADIAATVAPLKGSVDLFGICCGDIVSADHSMYAPYNAIMERTGLRFRNSMGNHDMKLWGRSHETSMSAYENVYGPAWYSYNVGEVHYVVLNNNFYIGRDWYYVGYLDEPQMRWLEQDLATVPAGSTVVLTMHIPAFAADNVDKPFRMGEAAKTFANYRGLREILKPYKCHVLSGHMHTNTNYPVSDSLYEHNIAALSGAWWQGGLCIDGTPAGYAVFTVDGTDIECYYKSVGRAPDCQMSLFDGGEYPRFEGYAVANVWNCDEAWSVELWEDGVCKGPMERFSAVDPDVEELYSDPSELQHKWIAPTVSPNFFRLPADPSARRREVVATDRFGNVYRRQFNDKPAEAVSGLPNR